MELHAPTTMGERLAIPRRLSKSALLLLLTIAITATTLLLFITSAATTTTTTEEKSDPRRPIAATKVTLLEHNPAINIPIPIPIPTTSSSSPRRSNCQIIYVLGVEGSLHHGFMPVLKALAQQQIDPATGANYHVVKGHAALRAALFGSSSSSSNNKKKKTQEFDKLAVLPLTDPQLVQNTLDAICPSGKGEEEETIKHVILEGNSFPSGGGSLDDNDNTDGNYSRLTTARRRQRDWQSMTPLEIASSPLALQHPTNLYEFYDAFSPHADVRFVVLHRPYLDTIASHAGFDSGPIQHSNVISGFLLLLSRFLVGHLYRDDSSSASDGVQDGRKSITGVPLWTIVCTEQLSSKEFENQQQLLIAREAIVDHIANFLGWPVRSCPRCFDNWRESSKVSPELRLGETNTHILLDHAKALEGIWPPRRIEDGLPQQQCRM